MAEIRKGDAIYGAVEGTGRHTAGMVTEVAEDTCRVKPFGRGKTVSCRKEGAAVLEMRELDFDEVAELWLYERDMEDTAKWYGYWPERSPEPILAPSMEDTVYLLENILKREVAEEGMKSWDIIESSLSSYVTYRDETMELITPQSGVRWAIEEIRTHLFDIPYLSIFRDKLVMLALFFDGEEGGALPFEYIDHRFNEIWRSPLAFSDDPEELDLFLPRIVHLSDSGDWRASWFLGKLHSDPYYRFHDEGKASMYLGRVGNDAERSVRGDSHYILASMNKDLTCADKAISEKNRKAVILKAYMLLDGGKREDALSLLHSFRDDYLFTYLKGYTFPEYLEAMSILWREEKDPLSLKLWRRGDELLRGTEDIDASTDRLMDLYQEGMLDREQLSQNLETASEDAEAFSRLNDELISIDDTVETGKKLWDCFRLNFLERPGLTLKVTAGNGGADFTVEHPDENGDLFPFFFEDGSEIHICDSVRLIMDDEKSVPDGEYRVDAIGLNGSADHRGETVLEGRDGWSDAIAELTEFDED